MAFLLRLIGLIGDVHQEDRSLESVLKHCDSLSLDLVLCTGDVVDGEGDFIHCCRLLERHQVETVLGNHDRWLLSGTMRDLHDALQVETLKQAERAFLESLPPTREYQTVAGPLLLCHGVGDNDMSAVLPEDYGYALESNLDLQRLRNDRYYRLVIGGHSHQRMVRSFGDITFINAGTLKDEHEPCFAVADLEQNRVQFWSIQGRTHLLKTDCFDLCLDGETLLTE